VRDKKEGKGRLGLDAQMRSRRKRRSLYEQEFVKAMKERRVNFITCPNILSYEE